MTDDSIIDTLVKLAKDHGGLIRELQELRRKHQNLQAEAKAKAEQPEEDSEDLGWLRHLRQECKHDYREVDLLGALVRCSKCGKNRAGRNPLIYLAREAEAHK